MRGGAWLGEERGQRRERGLDDNSVCRSCGSSVDGARSSSVQTHAADAPCEIWEKETLGQRNGGGGGGVRETGGTLGCLSQHRHAAVPRNPSSKRGTASPSPWL